MLRQPYYMKLIQYLILAIFIVSGVLGFLLYQQKAGRIREQLAKKELGWEPVAIKKMCIVKGSDTLWLVKQDGLWKSNRHFDAMGIAQQLLIYLSTMQIQPVKPSEIDSAALFREPIFLQSFDKAGTQTNRIVVGAELASGKSYAQLNGNPTPLVLSSSNNKLSLRTLLETFLSRD